MLQVTALHTGFSPGVRASKYSSRQRKVLQADQPLERECEGHSMFRRWGTGNAIWVKNKSMPRPRDDDGGGVVTSTRVTQE